MSNAIEYIAFAVNNSYQLQHSKVIKPIKCLAFTTVRSTSKAALLFTYQNDISTKFNMLVNQKHHPILGSITIEKIPKILM